MTTHINYSLHNHNTFGIRAVTKVFYEVYTEDELKTVMNSLEEKDCFILGGGSNVLFLGDLKRPVVKINIKGVEIIEENEHEVVVRFSAGENWHQAVLWSLSQGYGGIENLSLIPGNCGTAPIQNIGAYGVELKDVMVGCTTLNRKDLTHQYFTAEACEFGYRNSVFKSSQKDQWIITSIDLKLTKKNHQIKLEYGAIKAELSQMGVQHPTPEEVSKAVIRIRKSKLPNPVELPNCGSFFKNPTVSSKTFQSLEKKFPNLPHYPIDGKNVKIPAGWLIEQCGFKGYRKGNVGVHKNQALVLVNYNQGTGQEIKALSEEIQHSVKQKFDIALDPEVNFIP